MSTKPITQQAWAAAERLKERHKAGDPDVVQPKRVRKPKTAKPKMDSSIPKNRTLH